MEYALFGLFLAFILICLTVEVVSIKKGEWLVLIIYLMASGGVSIFYLKHGLPF